MAQHAPTVESGSESFSWQDDYSDTEETVELPKDKKTMPPAWRSMEESEVFNYIYGYTPDGGKRAYMVSVTICFGNHQNCQCYLSRNLLLRRYVLEHSNVFHGRYPIQPDKHSVYLDQLKAALVKEYTPQGSFFSFEPFFIYGCLVDASIRCHSSC